LSLAQTAALGAIAGATIFIGLPLGRIKVVGTRMRVALAMFSVGVLIFLLVDVLAHGFELAEGAVEAAREGDGTVGAAVGLTLLLLAGFALGCAGLGLIERRLHVSSSPLGDDEPEDAAAALRRRSLRTGLIIAAAIGIHNFAEGLAIGVAASSGAVALATVLIIGFALHNATEGFGIVGPLGDVKPTWAWLGLAGLIGGGPTFLGSLVGYHVTSDALELLFYAVAGGAIVYVIGEIWHGMRRHGHRELALTLLTCGFAAGVVTDFVVVLGGG
jgi:ZIP family zinc transporter